MLMKLWVAFVGVSAYLGPSAFRWALRQYMKYCHGVVLGLCDQKFADFSASCGLIRERIVALTNIQNAVAKGLPTTLPADELADLQECAERDSRRLRAHYAGATIDNIRIDATGDFGQLTVWTSVGVLAAGAPVLQFTDSSCSTLEQPQGAAHAS